MLLFNRLNSLLVKEKLFSFSLDKNRLRLQLKNLSSDWLRLHNTGLVIKGMRPLAQSRSVSACDFLTQLSLIQPKPQFLLPSSVEGHINRHTYIFHVQYTLQYRYWWCSISLVIKRFLTTSSWPKSTLNGFKQVPYRTYLIIIGTPILYKNLQCWALAPLLAPPRHWRELKKVVHVAVTLK